MRGESSQPFTSKPRSTRYAQDQSFHFSQSARVFFYLRDQLLLGERKSETLVFSFRLRIALLHIAYVIRL